MACSVKPRPQNSLSYFCSCSEHVKSRICELSLWDVPFGSTFVVSAKIRTWQDTEGTGRLWILQDIGANHLWPGQMKHWRAVTRPSSATQQSITRTQEPKLGNSAKGWKQSANCASFRRCWRPREYALESEVKNQVQIRWPLQNNNARQDEIVVICIVTLAKNWVTKNSIR